MNNEKLVEVYRASGELRAEMIRNMLDSFGIPCVVRSLTAPSVHAFTEGAYRVMVPTSKAEEARELINSNNDDV